MKPSTAKSKGTATESMFVDYLRRWAPFAERRRLAGQHDRGDIAGVPGIVFEVKSGARLAVAAWLDELDAEMLNDGAAHGAVVVRPKGKPDPADWFAIVRVPDLLDLLVEAEWLTKAGDKQ